MADVLFDEILMGNIRGKQGEAGFAPRINADTGTWERWNGEEWADTGVEAQGEAADITGQSLYEYAVINGFAGSYDDWLKEYLGRHTDLPWCSGYFQDRSLPVGDTPVTPIVVSANANIVDGNNFLATSNGIYALSVGGGMTAGSANWGMNVHQNYGTPNKKELIITGITPNYFQTSGRAWVGYLDEGEFLTTSFYTNAALSTFTAYGALSYFSFSRLR